MKKKSLLAALLCTAAAVVTACSSLGKNPPRTDVQPWPEIRPDFRVEALRGRMQEYSITFAAEVERAATAIARRAPDATVQRNALLWKLRAVPEMRKACFRAEPVAALLDAWTFARQMDQFFTEGAGAAAFGAFQADAVEASRKLLGQLREVGDSIAVSREATAQLERNVVDPWLALHPIHDLSFARESPISRFADQARARGDAFQSVGSIEDILISLSTQARIYLSDLPRHVRGEIDLLRADVLPPEDLVSIQRDLHSSAEAVSRLTTIAGGVPELVRGERKLVLDELSRQRVLFMDAVADELTQAIRAMARVLAAERNLVLDDVEWQRRATLAWATAERRETTASARHELIDVGAAVRRERTVLVHDIRRIVDVVSLRVALFVVGGLLVAPLIAHIYARVWPRRWRKPESR